ncbi:MAG: restriction endonuclease subunit S [Bacteroidales bacterium]|nr:restriction endonuclease subunit S [Bacteroidales bacterium]
MNNIQQCVWNAFRIEDIFEVRRGNAKDVTKRSMRGTTALVTAIDSNNAVSGMTTVMNREIIFNPSLTVHNNGNGVGLVFVHNYRFVATSDVTVLTLKEEVFNEYVLRYFIPIIQKQRNKFNYGYKLANNRLKAQTIMLPAKNGKPDYAYMEAYMRNAEKLLLKRYKGYLINVMPSQEPERVSIDGKRWKSFNIDVVFPIIQRGKRLKTEDHVIGLTPYVSSSSMFNGVDDFISNTNGVRRFKNCLTLANSGSVGETFYQPFEFVASDHVTKLENPLFDKYVYLFIATVVKRLSEKYSFNREINDSRIRREMIMLPVNEKGVPDYAFMSAYMKRLEYDILVDYIKKKS